MKLSPLLLTIRAISADFARRLYVPIFWIAAAILVVAHILGIWLITISSWWWILETLFIIVTIAAMVIAGIVLVIVKFLRPSQTMKQRKMVRLFVDDLQSVAETVQTPKPLLLFRLAKDTLAPSKRSLVSEMAAHATNLKPDFQAITDSFKQK